jgi:hypothetical protein
MDSNINFIRNSLIYGKNDCFVLISDYSSDENQQVHPEKVDSQKASKSPEEALLDI